VSNITPPVIRIVHLFLTVQQYGWTLKTVTSPAVEALFALAKSRLPAALETKFAEFPVALVDTHGKDLTISADPSRSGTPAPAATSATAAASTSAPIQPKKVEAKAINTKTVKVDATFQASAEDLFGLLTDEKRIPMWTRAPAQVPHSTQASVIL
jgi:activator of HSP90 ATPase